ncbi:hypothetical protein ECB98_04455 [Brucellaceae bacterium VT-16-1752]|nr:hypothetical protein ECB98_04455 [Brucellaceae bacterium VT-16-1752]
MTARTEKRSFAARPGDAESWIKAGEMALVRAGTPTAAFTARLTIDITPELRGRIKIAAFRRGVTASDMLRDLLEREFPGTQGGDTP